MIFGRPCLTQSRTPKGQGRCQSSKIGGRDDRSGDAGCTHTDRFKLEAPSARCDTLGAQGSICQGRHRGDGDTASTTLEHLRPSAGILTRG
jgi:hypothetical protein